MLPVAAANHVRTGLSAFDIAVTMGAAAITGAVFGALVGSAVRNPSIAVAAAVVRQFVETLLIGSSSAGRDAGPFLPIQLVGSATGLSGDVNPLAAVGLLLVYLRVFAFAIGKWALPRDLT